MPVVFLTSCELLPVVSPFLSGLTHSLVTPPLPPLSLSLCRQLLVSRRNKSRASSTKIDKARADKKGERIFLCEKGDDYNKKRKVGGVDYAYLCIKRTFLHPFLRHCPSPPPPTKKIYTHTRRGFEATKILDARQTGGSVCVWGGRLMRPIHEHERKAGIRVWETKSEDRGDNDQRLSSPFFSFSFGKQHGGKLRKASKGAKFRNYTAPPSL